MAIDPNSVSIRIPHPNASGFILDRLDRDGDPNPQIRRITTIVRSQGLWLIQSSVDRSVAVGTWEP
jgi:hypothetical protein